MPCYYPRPAWYSRTRNPSGKRSLVFKEIEGDGLPPIKLPCGQCIGCRLEYSRQWAIRCVNEASCYETNCFITLTFNDCFLKPSLDKRDFQLFMKRLRRRFGDHSIRYYHCGEYGEQLCRPHHHACLFNFDFPDKVLWSVKNDIRLYRSAELEKLWSCPQTGASYGFSSIGDVTFDSAAYVARYMLKKLTGDAAQAYGERLAPYTTCSRRPGIGRPFFDKYHKSIYNSDSVIIRGKEVKPPKYYDNLYDNLDCISFRKVKASRKSKIDDAESTPSRLSVKEKIKRTKTKELKRNYESMSV